MFFAYETARRLQLCLQLVLSWCTGWEISNIPKCSHNQFDTTESKSLLVRRGISITKFQSYFDLNPICNACVSALSCAGSSLPHTGCLSCRSEGYSLADVHWLLTAVVSLVAEPGFWGCKALAVAAHGLQSMDSAVWYTGLVAPWHVESSQTRDQNCVPCIGKQVLNHWTTREVLNPIFKIYNTLLS